MTPLALKFHSHLRSRRTSCTAAVHRLYTTIKPTKEQLALVVGSSGALGSTIVSHLQKSKNRVTVIGADVNMNDKVDVDAFIKLNVGGSVDQISSELENGFKDLFESKPEFDHIICANGGFSMDINGDGNSGDSDNVFGNMLEMNYNPTAAACSEAILPFITTENGLFVAFGAMAARDPLDDNSLMKGYIKSKKEVHGLIERVGKMTGQALKKSKGLHITQNRRKFQCLHELTALAILPSTLDTPANRDAMNPSNEELNQWTKLDDVAKEILTWIDMEDLRPHSGSFLKCVTTDRQTEFIMTTGGNYEA